MDRFYNQLQKNAGFKEDKKKLKGWGVVKSLNFAKGSDTIKILLILFFRLSIINFKYR